MAVINGNQTVRGTISANSLLFKEVIEDSSMTRGANINLVNGRIYYKIDNDNIFEFYTRTDIDELLANFTPSSQTVNQQIVAEDYDIFKLLNTTFFSISDTSTSRFININFDFSNSQVKASYTFDKINSSIFKNGLLSKTEYWSVPLLSLNTYRNTDVLGDFSCIRFDNSSANPTDQTIIDNIYLSNLLEQSASDTTTLLDALLYNNANDYTILIDSSNLLYGKFFSLNQINYKMDLVNRKNYLSDIYKRIFDNDSILCFINNYLTLYKDSTMNRLRVYFFDYRFFVYQNIFSLVNYLKNVFDYPGDYTNQLSQNILTYKTDHIDVTSQTKDYTSFEWMLNADELIQAIFESDSAFTSMLDWSSLDITVSVYKQNITSLSNPVWNELDIVSPQSFVYYGDGDSKLIMDRLNLSDGEFWVPLIEVDFPLDSYFYFMM